METAMPFQTLMAEPERKSVAGGEQRLRRQIRATFFPGVIEPCGPEPGRALEIVKSHINVRLRQVSVLSNDIRPRSCQEAHGQLADTEIPILHARTIATQIKRIEIVDVDVLPPVIPLTGPELCVRLTVKHVAHSNERLAKTVLVVANAIRKARITLRVRSVGFYHELSLHPRAIGPVFGVDPIVDQDQFGIGFGLIAQTEFGFRPRRLEGNLLSTHAVETVTGTEVPVEFEYAHFFLQFLDLRIGFP